MIVLLCAALAAGCGNSMAGQQESLKAGATPSYDPISRSEACPGRAPEHLPAGQKPVARAYVCTDETRRVPGDGEWLFSVVKGVTGGLDALLEVYGTPDAEPSNGVCTLDLPFPLLVWLHGDDVTGVRAPVDGCSKPIPEAGTAYRNLVLTEVTATKVRRIRSEPSITSGCPEQYKDMLAIEQEMAGPRRSSPKPEPLSSGSRVCRYDAKDEEGQLRSAGTPTASELSGLNEALAQSVQDPTCSRTGHTKFALVWNTSNSSSTLVALDGCAVQQDGGWWRATDRLRELLAAS